MFFLNSSTYFKQKFYTCRMFFRDLMIIASSELQELSSLFKSVATIGLRQSGKTTLVKACHVNFFQVLLFCHQLVDWH